MKGGSVKRERWPHTDKKERSRQKTLTALFFFDSASQIHRNGKAAIEKYGVLI
jgi:hypothetical protein